MCNRVAKRDYDKVVLMAREDTTINGHEQWQSVQLATDVSCLKPTVIKRRFLNA